MLTLTRALIPALTLLLAVSCKGGPVDTSGGDADTDTDVDSDTDTDSDTEVDRWQGTDADGDGFAAEWGDCDDNDIWVNPAWTEEGSRASDGKDNDCDGRIDETFKGVALLQYDTGGAGSQLVGVSGFGDITGSPSLTIPVFANWSDENLAGDGWAMWDGQQLKLFDVKYDGSTTVLFDMSTHDFGEDEPPAIQGMTTHHKGGYYLVSGVDRLFKISDGGTGTFAMETVATWTCLEEDGSHELAPTGIAASRATGEVALFGFFGGFGWWYPDTGFELVNAGNAEEPTHQLVAAQVHRADGYYALGTDLDSGEMGVFRWNHQQQKLVLRGTIPDADFVPVSFAIEDETGDFYFTSNPGQWRTVWRMVHDGSYTTMLYPGDSNPLNWDASPTTDYGAVGIVWE